MIPPFDIPVQMRFEDEQARQAQQSQQPPANPGQPPRAAPIRRVNLRPVTGFEMSNLSADLGDDDSLTLEKVEPGLYHLALSWRPSYVKSIRAGSVETEGDILDVRNGPSGPITVTVSSSMCQINGTVSDSSGPLAGVRVALVQPVESGISNPLIATTAADGTYTLPGVPPGKYKLLLADDDAMAALPGQNLDDYEDIAESVELHAGDKITKDLRVRK